MKSATRAVKASGEMPAHRLARAKAIRSSPISPIAAESPESRAANSGLCARLGSLPTAVLSTSTKKSNWTYVGFSHQSVPSLSRHATRFARGTAAAASRKASTASRVGPGRHEGNRSAGSGIGILSSYAPEAEVAHAGVDHLRTACRRSVAQAVRRGAQVRPALDHLPSDPELGLVRV